MITHSRYDYALSITSQFFFCGIPFRLDSVSRCFLNCRYCFSASRGGKRSSINKKFTDPDWFAKKFARIFRGNAVPNSINDELIIERVPVHFGGMSDPFADKETAKISKQLLMTLLKHDYPVVISTKNPLGIFQKGLMEEIQKKKPLSVQVSFTTFDESVCKVLEPKAPPPSARIHCIKLLTNQGIHVAARIQPILVPLLPSIRRELIPRLGEAGCKHVILEFLKIPVEKSAVRLKVIYKQLQWDGNQYYLSHNAMLIGREYCLPPALKWKKMQPLVADIHSNQMTFGAADYGLNHLGDKDCCCGVDDLPGFPKWLKGNFSFAIRNARPFEPIRFSVIEKQWLPKNPITRYINSHSRLQKNNNLLNHLVRKWNSPGSVNAPDSYLGVAFSGEVDEEGNCIYIKHQKV